ncbi:O-acetyltransferase OatA [compost metagenome]
MNKYRPEIDGLRTVAVIAVIIFHLNSNFLIGGYYGVDVFFVISGYLITGILTRSIVSKTFNMSDFWLKRVKRIIPLLLTVIITILVVCPFLIFKPTFSQGLKDIIPAIFSYFNFHAYFNFGDYWGQAADQSFFLHTWSLSVEEQFYLIYPFVLLLLNKYFKSFLVPLILITVASLGLFLYFVNAKPQLAFYMLPFRIWELSLGGVVACLPKFSDDKKLQINFAPILGLILIFITYFFATKSISYIAVLPVFGASLIIYFSNGKDVVSKILSTKFFTHIGKLSYSLYLWHWPIIVLFKNLEYKLIGIEKNFIYLLIICLTYTLSLISYKLIETKLRHNRATPKLVMGTIGFCVLLIVFFKSPYFDVHYKSLYNKQTLYFRSLSVTPSTLKDDNPLIYDVLLPMPINANANAYKEDGILQIINNKNPSVLMIGDSHGVMWAKTIQEVTAELNLSSSLYTTNASRPFFNLKNLNDQQGNNAFTKVEKADFAKSIINNMTKWKIKLLVISCRWENLKTKDKAQFENFIDYLNFKNIKILIINQPPQISVMNDVNTRQFISYLKISPVNGFNTVEVNQDNVIKSNVYLNNLKQTNSNVILYDVFTKLYQDDKVKITFKKDVLYFDDDHLSHSGTELFKEDIKDILRDFK